MLQVLMELERNIGHLHNFMASLSERREQLAYHIPTQSIPTGFADPPMK